MSGFDDSIVIVGECKLATVSGLFWISNDQSEDIRTYTM